MAGLGLYFTVDIFFKIFFFPEGEQDQSFIVGFVFYFSYFVAGNDEGCEVNLPK